MHLPNSNIIPHQICDNPKFAPFFKDAIGAIDGSYINASPLAILRPVYRNQKGVVSQNWFFACDFNLKFVYSLTSWEGSATDAHVYKDSWSHDFNIPPNKYYLADAGFPLSPGLLVPYRGVRYHLAEWGRGSTR